MSYKRSGLGQTAFRVPDDVENGLQILSDMIRHWDARARATGNQPVVNRVRTAAERWYQATQLANFEGRFDEARRLTGEGISIIQQVAPVVMRAESLARPSGGAFSPGVEREVTELERGSSFATQVGRSLSPVSITEPIAQAVAPISPALAETVRGSGWLVPLAIGGGAIFLLSRR